MIYKILMKKPHCHYKQWIWVVYGTNGRHILTSKTYENRAQCRNVMEKFALEMMLPFKEVECNRPDHICRDKRRKK